ncbi:hypothetical protein C1878_04950 [Gordonibacter sp. 28C]|nr:hypothetical protein C1878_04950 [Gordonibacter sp. 28C]
MCFRPPDAQLKPLKCPECGKRINNPNFRPDKCPFCGAFLPAELDGMDAYLPPSGVPGKPEAPSAPKGPGIES